MTRNSKSGSAAICVGLAACVFACLSPILRNGFTGYDDPEYVTANPQVASGLSLRTIAWAFTTAHSSNWHPLTWISHAIDCSLFGLAPAGHHFTNLLLHAINTVLLFLWLSGVTGLRGRSAFAALLFGLHPLHVESVAWVAERKDVLSTMFWMLTLLAYTAYVRGPTAGRYLLVAALFTAGLLSKPMLVTVPLLLLVIDWWPLGRTGGSRGEPLSRLALEKVPLLILSGISCASAVWAQRVGGSMASLDDLPLALRISNAIVSYVRYIGKTILPVNLAVFYPLPDHGIPAWEVAVSLLILGVVTWLAFAARKLRPWLAAGWIWYVLTLLPVIGFVQVGMQSMADRYMYVPMIGLLIMAAWECAEALKRLPAAARLAPAAARLALAAARLAPAAAALPLLACAILSWQQAHVWKDGLTLFTHAVQVTKDNFVAHDNLGVELDRRGRLEEALAEYRETLRIKAGDRNGEANYAQASFAKGERLFAAGNLNDALDSFREGLRYRPRNAEAHAYTGLILTQENRLDAAVAEFREAVAIDPTLARAYMGLGVALARAGRPIEAKQAFENTLRYDPATVEAHYDLGLVQQALGNNTEALASYEAALRLKPEFGPALASRAEILYALGQYDEAWRAVLAAQAAHAQPDPVIAAKLATRFQK